MSKSKIKPYPPKISSFLRETHDAKISVDELTPAFSFEKMQDKSGHSVNCCDDIELSRLLKKLFMLSKLPWRQIREAPRTGFGTEKINRNSIKLPIPTNVTDDVQSFLRIRYHDRKPFIGYRIDRIFYILWVDFNNSVYDHG